MTEAKNIWLIGLAMVVFTVAKLILIQPGFSDGLPFNLYYASEAFTHFILALFIYTNFPKKWIAFALLIFTINNLADELFFNPLEIQVNEFALVTVLLISGYAYTKIKEYESYD